MLEGGGGRDTDAEMFRGERDGGGELQRIVHRDLRGLVDGMVVRALVDVVIADDVGDEDAVEDAALQRAGKVLPIVQVLVLEGLVARMRPQAGGLVANAVHVEGVETDMACHGYLQVSRMPDGIDRRRR